MDDSILAVDMQGCLDHEAYCHLYRNRALALRWRVGGVLALLLLGAVLFRLFVSALLQPLLSIAYFPTPCGWLQSGVVSQPI